MSDSFCRMVRRLLKHTLIVGCSATPNGRSSTADLSHSGSAIICNSILAIPNVMDLERTGRGRIILHNQINM